jgi:FkbM family methyltransferase
MTSMVAESNRSRASRAAVNRRVLWHIMTLVVGLFLGYSLSSSQASFKCAYPAGAESDQQPTLVASSATAVGRSNDTTSGNAAFSQRSGSSRNDIAKGNTSTHALLSQTISSNNNGQLVSPVDCSTISDISPVHLARMASADAPYMVSFSWWDRRLAGKQEALASTTLRANQAVGYIQKLLLSLNDTSSRAFIDVGANVGFMTNFATITSADGRNRPVFAIDPISYDIAKICEGYRANLGAGRIKATNPAKVLHLYHAAAGPSFEPNMSISRPPDSVGFFDQSSLSRDAIKRHAFVVQEFIPMLTIDSIIPDDVPIGVVKVDVQGHEYGVLQGMTSILSRTVGYPLHVFYEEKEFSQSAAGVEIGASAKLLKSFGYTCMKIGKSDMLCSKA